MIPWSVLIGCLSRVTGQVVLPELADSTKGFDPHWCMGSQGHREGLDWCFSCRKSLVVSKDRDLERGGAKFVLLQSQRAEAGWSHTPIDA